MFYGDLLGICTGKEKNDLSNIWGNPHKPLSSLKQDQTPNAVHPWKGRKANFVF